LNLEAKNAILRCHRFFGSVEHQLDHSQKEKSRPKGRLCENQKTNRIAA
jgi:hypothetical protein